MHIAYQIVAELLQHLVAHGVAILLVEVFKVLKIAVHDDVAPGIAAHDLVLDLLPEAAEAQQTGEPVKVRGGHHAPIDGVGRQMLGEIGIDDLGDLPQLFPALLRPKALAAAHHIGDGPQILALAVHGGIDHGFRAPLHQQGGPAGGIHVHVVILQNGGAVFVIALEQGEKVLLGKAALLLQSRRGPGGGPLELPAGAVLFNVRIDDGDAVQLQADAHDL